MTYSRFLDYLVNFDIIIIIRLFGCCFPTKKNEGKGILVVSQDSVDLGCGGGVATRWFACTPHDGTAHVT